MSENPPAHLLGVGLLALVVSLTVAFGVGGLVLAFVLGIVWYLVPVPYVIAAGHLLALSVAPAELVGSQLLVVTAGFLTVLAVEALDDDRPVTVLAALVLGALVLLGAAWLGLRVGASTVAGALVLALVFAGTSYGLHRYELVSLGLVEGTNE